MTEANDNDDFVLLANAPAQTESQTESLRHSLEQAVRGTGF